MRNMMYTAQLDNQGPWVIRYPRGRGVMTEWKTPFKKLAPGKGRMLKEGNDIAILTIGPTGNRLSQVADQLEKDHISVAHYDMRFLKPIDEELLNDVFRKFDKVITVEDGTIIGGLGSAVLEFMADHHYRSRVKRLGIPDRFIGQGSLEELHDSCGYDTGNIIKTVLELMDPENS